MKIPKTIKVGQFTYKIKFITDELRNDNGHLLYGQARHFEKEIVLSEKANKVQQAEAFVHEMLHCLETVYVVSEKGLPEETVTRLGTALHKFILDNERIFIK